MEQGAEALGSGSVLPQISYVILDKSLVLWTSVSLSVK